MTDWITSGSWSLDELAKRRLESALQKTRGPRVLDVGCRDGTFSLSLARTRPEWKVEGIDTDSTSVQWANDTAVKLGIENAVFSVNSILSTDASRVGAYDTVVCMETLEHLPINGVAGAFDTLLSYVKPGGTLLISVPANSHISDPDHKTTFYREQFHGRPGLEWVPECPHLWMMFTLSMSEEFVVSAPTTK